MSITRIDAVLFDKDGTIFDSEHANKTAWMASTQTHGIAFSDAQYHSFVGVPTQDCFNLARRVFPQDFDWDSFLKTLEDNMQANVEQGIPFKQGFEALFTHLKANKVPLGLVTSAQRRGTELSFQHSGYLQDFHCVVTVDDVSQPKPHPEPYLLACKTLGVEPKHTLVFEDSNVGLKAAIAAGCITVAIPDLVDIDGLIANECHGVLNSLDEAYELINLNPV